MDDFRANKVPNATNLCELFDNGYQTRFEEKERIEWELKSKYEAVDLTKFRRVRLNVMPLWMWFHSLG